MMSMTGVIISTLTISDLSNQSNKILYRSLLSHPLTFSSHKIEPPISEKKI